MTQTASAATANPVATANSVQYLTFVCADEAYGVDILRVQEIKGWDHVTRVPYVAPYILGVMNLRGVIVPVIDLRARFTLAKRARDASTVVIVVRVHSSRGDKTVGIVVDGVSDVCSFTADAIKPTPDFAGSVNNGCISGIAKVDGKLVMLLDIDSLGRGCVETAASAHLNA